MNTNVNNNPQKLMKSAFNRMQSKNFCKNKKNNEYIHTDTKNMNMFYNINNINCNNSSSGLDFVNKNNYLNQELKNSTENSNYIQKNLNNFEQNNNLKTEFKNKKINKNNSLKDSIITNFSNVKIIKFNFF